MMVTNILSSVTLVLALGISVSAQPAPSPASPPQTPVRPDRPQFEIPKRDGQSGQPRPTPLTGEVYVIGPQDSLSIIVTDEADLTNKYRVDTDAEVARPYLTWPRAPRKAK